MGSCLGVCCREANRISFTNDFSSSNCWEGCASGQPEILFDPNGPRLLFGISCKPFKRMAGTTRLELATSAVTVRGCFSVIHYLSALPLSSGIKNRVATISRR
jgi:hypothetical protein